MPIRPEPGTINGHFGSALWFDGSASSSIVPDALSLDLTQGMTLEGWVYPLSVNQWNPILLKAGIGELDCYVLQASIAAGLGAELQTA